MTIEQLVSGINQMLAGEMLERNELLLHINMTIDEINDHLNAAFPAITSLDAEYTAIPDKYLRSVVMQGATYKYYVMDEEGERVASEFFTRYYQNLFLMLRDYAEFVPEEFRADPVGFITDDGDEGVTVSGDAYQV